LGGLGQVRWLARGQVVVGGSRLRFGTSERWVMAMRAVGVAGRRERVDSEFGLLVEIAGCIGCSRI